MLRGTKTLAGCRLRATDGDLGALTDGYFDDHRWVIRYLMMDAGAWLADRQVLISPISLQQSDWASRWLQVEMTRDQVRNIPEIDAEGPLSRQHEVRFLGHCGFANYWDGAGPWGAGTLPMGLRPGHAEAPNASPGCDPAKAVATRPRPMRRVDDAPRLRRCTAVVGCHVQAADGEVGLVEDLLFDDQTWAIEHLLVSTSHWWAGHKVLIAPPWISGMHWSGGTVAIDLTREQVQALPGPEQGAP